MKYSHIGFLLLLLILLLSCNQPEALWKGSIKVVDGVTVVKNPKEPMYGSDVFQIEDDLSIGENEGPEEYMFSQVRGIAVDRDENIYVLDYRESHIKKFDKDGVHVWTIGKQGQGPGELNACFSISISSHNEIVVSDISSRRLSFFNLEGEYLRMLSMAKNLLILPCIDSDGNFYAVMTEPGKINSHIAYQKFSPTLEYILTFDSKPSSLDYQAKKYYPFKGTISCTLTPNEKVIFGNGTIYELKLFDTDGTYLMKIIKDYEPVEIEKEVLEEVGNRQSPPGLTIELSKHYNPYAAIFNDDENRIFVRTYEKMDDKYIYDVFDGEGRCIASVPLKSQPVFIKKGKLYSLEEDEDGFHVVKRYKVTWKY